MKWTVGPAVAECYSQMEGWFPALCLCEHTQSHKHNTQPANKDKHAKSLGTCN